MPTVSESKTNLIIEGCVVIVGGLLVLLSNNDWIKIFGIILAFLGAALLVYQLLEIGGGNLKRGRDSS